MWQILQSHSTDKIRSRTHDMWHTKIALLRINLQTKSCWPVCHLCYCLFTDFFYLLEFWDVVHASLNIVVNLNFVLKIWISLSYRDRSIIYKTAKMHLCTMTVLHNIKSTRICLNKIKGKMLQVILKTWINPVISKLNF